MKSNYNATFVYWILCAIVALCAGSIAMDYTQNHNLGVLIVVSIPTLWALITLPKMLGSGPDEPL